MLTYDRGTLLALVQYWRGCPWVDCVLLRILQASRVAAISLFSKPLLTHLKDYQRCWKVHCYTNTYTIGKILHSQVGCSHTIAIQSCRDLAIQVPKLGYPKKLSNNDTKIKRKKLQNTHIHNKELNQIYWNIHNWMRQAHKEMNPATAAALTTALVWSNIWLMQYWWEPMQIKIASPSVTPPVTASKRKVNQSKSNFYQSKYVSNVYVVELKLN